MSRPDVLVVGAGTSGCALAARLADAGREVLLLEAGAVPLGREEWPAEVLDPASLAAAAPGHAANWDLAAEVIPGRAARVPRGRIAGGSSAVNAAVFVRARRADFDAWAAGPLWTYDAVLPAFRRLETDHDFGTSPDHGDDGPVPVRRLPSPSPLADAFAAACAELGLPDEPDKNGESPSGYGRIPFNVDRGVRINAAIAYLAPRRALPNLTVRGGVAVRRVLVEDGRAVGVLTDDGPVHAGEVVLSAGAVGSAYLLLVSGLGPARDLRAAGIEVVADLPGVGSAFSDHPLVYVPYRPDSALPPATAALHGLLHLPLAGSRREVELMPWLRPFAGDAEPAVSVGLQHPVGRGRLSLAPDDPIGPPRLEYGHLGEADDRHGLREGVRTAAALLGSAAFAEVAARSAALPDAVLEDDAVLDAWLLERVTTAVHLSGTAPMGPDSDPGAVVDQHLRVRGVAGLRVVDTSVLPTVPSRGTAATAILLGERAAELMT
ncbi:mycofactocin system GMC family oxidoreductase MftG [Blastococcus sp. CCUG 61487]|uniref:mycofactocin dehydrogenase MftG n=1 Tax=Blastococcus sp. CCUG 61487 TaxID=1840703 RepID=UPI0010BFD172|nr:mycofactocin system GMC family oxidoreductase MftG [Blastococcus sp. CCUG 61487]TKJ28486.1 glucose-methanol-choline oxidoreductase [Blastococcus sp. CCUG 61487]